MNRRLPRVILGLLLFLAIPRETPAPLIYRAGEGWTYEPVGGGKWARTRAKDQLEVAQAAFDKKDYRLAIKAARRTVRAWPMSDYAPKAQYLLAQAYEGKGQDEKAFKAYQTLVEKYPKAEVYEEVLKRQFEIANRYLGGQWFKIWGVIPFFPSMDKTSDMYEKLIKNGPYSEVAPRAQMNIGAAREKQSNFPLAVKAYETAADRYHEQTEVASEAMFKAGLAYQKQAQTSEYDQSLAGESIETFGSFVALFPEDPRVTDAQKIIGDLKTEQARGSFQIARFYEKRKQWEGALVYYNEVLIKDPNSKWATDAKERIETLRKRTGQETSEKQ